jgi:hypothetical protein
MDSYSSPISFKGSLPIVRRSKIEEVIRVFFTLFVDIRHNHNPTDRGETPMTLAINSPLADDLQSSKFSYYVLSRFRCLQIDVRLLDDCIVILQIIIANSLPIAEGESEGWINPLIIDCYINRRE